jgi:hypothetical protein
MFETEMRYALRDLHRRRRGSWTSTFPDDLPVVELADASPHDAIACDN